MRLRAQIVRLWNLPLGFFLFSLPGPVVGIEKAGAVLHRRHHQHLGCPGSQAEIEFKKYRNSVQKVLRSASTKNQNTVSQSKRL